LRPKRDVRRLIAFLAILLIIGLVLTLLWEVYLHHEEANPDRVGTSVVAHAKITSPPL
jgi:hypothetical protein